jgi:hypothetical protein
MAFIACGAIINPAMAESCVTRSEAMALKTAAVQQQLMVAAYQCNGVKSYNSFVRAYQPELRASDAALKAYFVRSSGSERGYDAYKSKVANVSALSQSQDSNGFCNASHELFAAALSGRGSLASFVADAPSPPGYRDACIVADAGPRVRVSEAGR